MCCTCSYAVSMPVMIQIRHVPEGLHRKLKARAAGEGTSLSEYLLREIERLADLPTSEEMKARLAARSRVNLHSDPAAMVRAERDSQ
jgi:antitoxin FitA